MRARVRARPNERDLHYDSESVRKHIERCRELGNLNGFVSVSTDDPLETVYETVRVRIDELVAKLKRLASPHIATIWSTR